MTHRHAHRTREAYQKKQGCKRQKSMRGVPDNPYGELKRNVTVSLTPTAQAGLEQLSRDRQVSRSELFEQLGRGRLILVEVPQQIVEEQVTLLAKEKGTTSTE
ncbi:MAG: hypothetical protein KME43_24545 [Myxacorys chilensis ATA2-1-KO14]|jgi:hypothetical protein|nr:hypothetical protein [Myxacorys chilensis ATA2-1-KO14]